ncbi:MAG: hypothetical protein C0483_11805 [Pirellula sp.]|nr:hypothetical protein [Pirellula sp.]
MPPRAQCTAEEFTHLAGGGTKYQWGLGIGPDPCNLLYLMHEGAQAGFGAAKLRWVFKENIGQSQSSQCGGGGYLNYTDLYTGPDLGVIVVTRTPDGLSLTIRGLDATGMNQLATDGPIPIPAHWAGNCEIHLRGDNCLAAGVITV